jgi:hypothetical protein
LTEEQQRRADAAFDGAEGEAGAVGDFGVAVAVDEGEADEKPLLLGQLRDGLADETDFEADHLLALAVGLEGRVEEGFEERRSAGAAEGVEGSAAGDQIEPGEGDAAAVGVVGGTQPDVAVEVLHDLLGVGGVADELADIGGEGAAGGVVEVGHGVGVALGDAGEEIVELEIAVGHLPLSSGAASDMVAR